MKIGAALIFGMLALVILGYLVRHTFDAQNTINLQREEIAQLKEQLHQVQMQLEDSTHQKKILQSEISTLTGQLNFQSAQILNLDNALRVCAVNHQPAFHHPVLNATSSLVADSCSVSLPGFLSTRIKLQADDLEQASLIGLGSFTVLAALGFFILIHRIWKLKGVLENQVSFVHEKSRILLNVTREEAKLIAKNRRNRYI